MAFSPRISSSLGLAIKSSSQNAFRGTATASAAIPAQRWASSSSSSPSPSSSSNASVWTLPEISLSQTHPSRYRDHYHNVIAEDLMYMAYDHNLYLNPPEPTSRPSYSSSSHIPTPYEANRPLPAPRGNRPMKPSTKAITPVNLPKLEYIVLHTMVKESIGNKPALLNAIMALRCISGSTDQGLGDSEMQGVQIVTSKSGAAAFKLRAEMPVAVKVTLTGERMYTFLQSLVDFVLPRLREFPGLPLPLPSANKASPSALSGVVAFGFGPEAMALFPQIEANLDNYGKMEGFHVQCKTSARGKGAQDSARALLSGFRLPFARR